jgi:hypothetical protein
MAGGVVVVSAEAAAKTTTAVLGLDGETVAAVGAVVTVVHELMYTDYERLLSLEERRPQQLDNRM